MTIEQRLKRLEKHNIRMMTVVTLTAMCMMVTPAASETVDVGATQGWRNVVEDPSHYDDEMRRIDSMINVETAKKSTHHIRALISRFDAVVHYRAEDNLSLLVNAIGSGTYPDYPAVDVLARNWQIDEERRMWFMSWSRALAAWSRSEPSDIQLTMDSRVVVLDDLLGDRSRDKEWLAASLSKTLKCFVETPEERIFDLSDETFVRAVYQTAFGRDPSADDLSFRVQELAMGKGREVFVDEVFASEESNTRRLYRILNRASEIGKGD
jgi:hypothetical protein